MIDLVRDDLYAALITPVKYLGQRGLIKHRAGWVRRAGDDQAIERSLGMGMFEQLDRGLEIVLERGHEWHDLCTQCIERIAVTRVTRDRKCDPVASVERSKECQGEPT